MTLAWFATKTGNIILFGKGKVHAILQKEMGNCQNYRAGPGLVGSVCRKRGGAIPTSWKGDGANPVVFFTGGEADPNKYYFGGKGGRGTVSHGNMDAGSFVFELYGLRWSMDPGNYRSYGIIERTGFDLWGKCQDCDRWKLINKSNFGHSTISINNELHVVDGLATIIDFKNGENPRQLLI